MSMEVNGNYGNAQGYSSLSAALILETLEMLKQCADDLLASQNKVVDTLVKGDREQQKRLEQLTKKLEEARLPQTLKQLTAMQTKIEQALPKFQQLGDTETTLKLNTMLSHVEELKQQMANRQALSSGPAAPPIDTGLV